MQADYVTVVEDRPIMFVKYCLPVPNSTFGQNQRTMQRGLSAIAEHLVMTVLCFLLLSNFSAINSIF